MLPSDGDAVAYLERVVPVMRRLGVLEFDGLKLGAEPSNVASQTEDPEPRPAPVRRSVTGGLVPRARDGD